MTFEAQPDLAKFPDRSGTWLVTAGSAANSDTARLARRDLAAARSVRLRSTPAATARSPSRSDRIGDSPEPTVDLPRPHALVRLAGR